MYQDLKKLNKELEKIFGIESTNKVFSHLLSLHRAIEDLEKSRDNWKSKYFKLKSAEMPNKEKKR